MDHVHCIDRKAISPVLRNASEGPLSHRRMMFKEQLVHDSAAAAPPPGKSEEGHHRSRLQTHRLEEFVKQCFRGEAFMKKASADHRLTAGHRRKELHDLTITNDTGVGHNLVPHAPTDTAVQQL